MTYTYLPHPAEESLALSPSILVPYSSFLNLNRQLSMQLFRGLEDKELRAESKLTLSCICRCLSKVSLHVFKSRKHGSATSRFTATNPVRIHSAGPGVRLPRNLSLSPPEMHHQKHGILNPCTWDFCFSHDHFRMDTVPLAPANTTNIILHQISSLAPRLGMV
jgi:hypothetical protein